MIKEIFRNIFKSNLVVIFAYFVAKNYLRKGINEKVENMATV